MKKICLCIAAAILLLATCNTTSIFLDDAQFEDENPLAVLKSVPFSRGVNFPEWFESPGAQSIQFTKYNEQDFLNVKSMGADVIRLPIRMHSMTSGGPDYILDPLLFQFLDVVVGWAEKNEMYLILDNHSFDPRGATPEDVDTILVPVWTQVAERYKNRSKYIIYEILNEPFNINAVRWGEIQGLVIDAIRKVDQKHAIIAGGTDYNSIGRIFSIPKYTHENLIYTFHFYDPFMFTHQGSNWGEPSMASLAGVPFPADIKRMPKTPDNLKGTWVGVSLDNYERDASPASLRRSLDQAVAFSRSRDAPVFCGEFGVYMIQSPPADRIRWYKFVAEAMAKRNIPWTSWDYYGGFGIFKTPGMGDFFSDLNTDVVRAMGFTPPQQQRPSAPPKSDLVIFDNYISQGYSAGFWGTGSVFNMYYTSAAEGRFAIHWGNANRYDYFWLYFDRNRDLSHQAGSGYSLELKIRTEKPVRFDVRFRNPESSVSTPWRMGITIDEKRLPPDGQWHTIRIPLKDMKETGAYVNATQQFVGPQGKFSWSNVQQLDICAEHMSLKDIYIWIDSIKITRP